MTRRTDLLAAAVRSLPVTLVLLPGQVFAVCTDRYFPCVRDGLTGTEYVSREVEIPRSVDGALLTVTGGAYRLDGVAGSAPVVLRRGQRLAFAGIAPTSVNYRFGGYTGAFDILATTTVDPTPQPEPDPTPDPDPEPQPDPEPEPQPQPDPVTPTAGVQPSRYGKLTLPVDLDGNGSADEIPAAQLPPSGSYASGYFRMRDGTAIFTAPVDGDGTTSNAKYVRSELREQIVPGSDRDNWSLSGVHVQSGTVRVVQLPTPLLADTIVKTVVAQIHGVDSPPPVKLQVTQKGSNPLVVYAIYNRDPDGGGSFQSERVSIAPGQAFRYEIRVENGVLTTLIDDRVVNRHVMDARWAAETFYFKAGNYVQNTTSTATGSAEIEHSALSASHR